ncbi:MAG: hypothetical protein PHI73_03235 [Patescibacteria group bacterium]|nr:hypothetical protein [Patescibacteria group bacterium]
MNNRVRSVIVGAVSVLAVFVVASVARSAVSTFKGQGTLEVDSLKVGTQGSGGVTAFNGTIINNTTGANNADQPVTFGDNVRIDGRVYRGSEAGTSDTKPFIINDNAEIAGTLTVGGNNVTGTKRYTGTVDLAADGDFVSKYDYETDCTAPDSDEYIKYYYYHYKKVAVAEASITEPINIRVFYKPAADASYIIGPNPEGNNVWQSVGYTIGDGSVYFTYKTETETCAGTFADTNWTTGAYQVVVN